MAVGRVKLPVIETQATYFSPIKKHFGNLKKLAKKLNEFNSGFSVEQFQHAKMPPSSWYGKKFDKAEWEIFSNWIGIGSVADVAKPQDYFTVKVAGEPVVVLRDKEGTLRALSNFCRHNGALLLTEPKGKLDDKIICDYHEWGYKLQGALRQAPSLGKVDWFCSEDFALPKFEVATWGPLIFLRMLPKEDFFSTRLEPLQYLTEDLDLSAFKWTERWEDEVECNWKTYVENFLDGGYHVKSIHRKLAESLKLENYHTTVFDHCSLQHSPVQNNVNDSRQGNDARYFWLFPNTMVNIYENAMDTNIVIPLGPNKCKVIFDFYFTDKFTESDKKNYITGSKNVQFEDKNVCERIPHGIESRFYKPGAYAKPEIGKYHFHQLLSYYLKSAMYEHPEYII